MNAQQSFNYGDKSELSLQIDDDEFGDHPNLSVDGFKAHRKLISQLNVENEHYKQENHELQLKLATSITLQSDLQETIDLQEDSIKKMKILMEQKLHEAEEKNGDRINILNSKISELEQIILTQSDENTELQKKFNEIHDKLLSATIPTEVTFKDDVSGFEDKIQQLSEQLAEEHNVRIKLEHEIRDLHKESSELREIYYNTRERLAERDQTIEATRDELTECRMELDNLKSSPADQQSKGNSLFAELEDRRQKIYNTMMTYKQGYIDIKRTLLVRDNEIKALKAEKAALFTTLQNDRDETIQQNSNLLEKYKDKIEELSFKLKEQQKKYQYLESQMRPVDDKYQYFQKMLDIKNKEIEELHRQIADSTIKTLVDEEMKCLTDEQLRIWKYKATAKEAQLKAIESRLETESSSLNQELLQIIRQDKSKNVLNKKCYPEMRAIKQEKKDNDPHEESDDLNIHNNFNKVKMAKNAEDLLEVPKQKSPLIKDMNLIDLSSPVNKENESNSNCNDEVIKNTVLTENTFNTGSKLEEANNTNEKKGILKSSDETWSIPHIGMKATSLTSTSFSFSKFSEERDKDKKTLRFTEDTIDPKPSNLISRPVIPKYPIIYVSKDSTNETKNN